MEFPTGQVFKLQYQLNNGDISADFRELRAELKSIQENIRELRAELKDLREASRGNFKKLLEDIDIQFIKLHTRIITLK